jgi:hypothetical protein
MHGSRAARLVVGISLLLGAAWYLYDPPWVGGLTSGLRDWEEDPPGTRFRWTAGHASFYIPSDATEMTLPMRAPVPSPDGRPVIVRVSVDDRALTEIVITDPRAWVAPRLPLPRRATRRRYRRVDLQVSRTQEYLNLGVQLGEAQFARGR